MGYARGVSQKALLLFVVLALVGIAYYVRFKPHRGHGDGAEQASKKVAVCRDECVRTWTKCGAHCAADEACSKKCDRTRESCENGCR